MGRQNSRVGIRSFEWKFLVPAAAASACGSSDEESGAKSGEEREPPRKPPRKDTGYAVFFVEMGSGVKVVDGEISDATNEGIRRGYEEGRLRKSIARSPIARANTNDDTPSVIYYEPAPGETLTALPRNRINSVNIFYPKGWAMRTPLHRRTKRSATFLPALILSAAIFFFSGCAALGGGISQMQNDERTSADEPTMNDEPTISESTEADEANEEDAGASGDDATETVRAGDAEVTTGGGSVVVRAGDAEVTTGAGGTVARAGDVVAESGAGNEVPEGGDGGTPPAGTAVLRMAGDAGTAFSGDCVVGGEPTTLEGEVPARLEYDLAGDGGMACEIGKEGPGLLRVVLVAGDSRVVRETNAEDARIELVYQNGNVIASTSSESGSSSSVSSSSSSVSSSNSSSSVQNQSSSSSINQSVSVTD